MLAAEHDYFVQILLASPQKVSLAFLILIKLFPHWQRSFCRDCDFGQSDRKHATIPIPYFQVRMALPVMELYALFLERRPEEKERVEQARLLEAKVC